MITKSLNNYNVNYSFLFYWYKNKINQEIIEMPELQLKT